MTYLLHIDTSGDAGLVALGANGALLAAKSNDTTRNHAAAINNMVDGVLAGSGISLAAVSGIVVCAGPGSYTGLRIGMATAKGFCYALDKPLMLDNKLDLLNNYARSQHGDEYTQYITLLIAREKEYFACIYKNDGTCIVPAQHVTAQQLGAMADKKEKTYIITNVPEALIQEIGFEFFTMDPEINIDLPDWIAHGFQKYICNSIVNLSTAEPFYLKQVYTHK